MLAPVLRKFLALCVFAAAGLACNGLGAPPITSLRDAAAVDPGDDEPSPDAAAPRKDASGQPWASFPDGSFEVHSNEQAVVYAHSGSDLFGVDPETLVFTRLGNFLIHGPMRDEFLNNVTDIAVDRNGRVVGTTFNRLLDIDPKTAVCTVIAMLPGGHSFNGLSWIRSTQGEEQLVATTLDGNVYRIDPVSGVATHIGPLGMGLRSSGDVVSVAGYGTLITVTGAGQDQLAKLDPTTGAATVIGPTGFSKIWGLGFWKDKVFGFTQTGEFILIDPMTGAGKLVEKMPAFPFWGAGVTTSVPVIL
jgi:hypothetical protein